jgi:hypothetical protein
MAGEMRRMLKVADTQPQVKRIRAGECMRQKSKDREDG